MRLNRIARRLNPRLDEITLFHDLTQAETFEFEYLDSVRDEVESNMTLTGTTERCIARREAEFGIVSDEEKPISQRVSVILAKYRGRGTTTPEFIRNVARSFEYGEVIVNESTKDYVVIIEFQSVYGIPPNLQDFENAISDVFPAHLDIEYKYRYLTWNDYEGYNHTQDEWDALNLTWDELEVYHDTTAKGA